ncbi:MAG: type II secretion system F family protein [Pirellulales bacterium]|nr:type II secretion system F family protein [Pirellulales bacterium]
MFFAPRIRLKPLAQLCHRLSVATGAGLKDLKIWKGESQRGSWGQRRQIEGVASSLAGGSTLAQALQGTGNYFPPLFHQMVGVGEVSGQLDRTYGRLAEYYDDTLKAKKAFLGKLAWPALQLAMAVLVVGLLIFVMGMLPGFQQPGGEGEMAGFDMLGLGWIGTAGLIKYVNLLVFVAIVGLLLVEAIRCGVGWTRALQRFVLTLPVVGPAFRTLALSRFAWAFQLVLGTSMDLRQALPLVLDATGNDYFAGWGPEVALRIEQGQDIHTALSATGVFPTEMLDNIAVGEQSGRLAETMERMAREYQQRAATAISVLAQIAGYAVWILVSALIIALIFRLFSAYVGVLNEAWKPI